MKSSGRNLSLTSYDDLFATDESRSDAEREKVMEIHLSELFPFKDHPFKVKNDEKMQETADSIKEYGVLVPALARPRKGGGYEVISGHRRKMGCDIAGLETMPVVVRDMDDGAAVIIMVDSNIQRESLLPSERAFAYKMKLEAIKHQGARADLTSSQVGMKQPVKEATLLQCKVASNIEEMKENSGRIHLWMASFFQIHRSKFELDPGSNGGQPSVGCVAHRVFFFRVGKDAFDRLRSQGVGRFADRRMSDVLRSLDVVVPDMTGYGLYALLTLGALFSHRTVLTDVAPALVLPVALAVGG